MLSLPFPLVRGSHSSPLIALTKKKPARGLAFFVSATTAATYDRFMRT